MKRYEGLLQILQKKKMKIIDYVSCYAIYSRFKHDIFLLRQISLKIFQIYFMFSIILTKMLFQQFMIATDRLKLGTRVTLFLAAIMSNNFLPVRRVG